MAVVIMATQLYVEGWTNHNFANAAVLNVDVEPGVDWGLQDTAGKITDQAR